MIDIYLNQNKVVSCCLFCGIRFDPYSKGMYRWGTIMMLYSTDCVVLHRDDICQFCFHLEDKKLGEREYVRTFVSTDHIRYERFR